MTPKLPVKFGTAYRVFEVVNNYGGLGKLIGYFSRLVEANLAAQNRGWYGGRGDVKNVHTVTIDGLTYELADNKPIDLDGQAAKIKEEARKKVLAKLTKEEKQILNLGSD